MSASHLGRRAQRLLACVLAFICLAVSAPVPALAARKASDIVDGTPASERGLATSDLPDISAKQAIVMTPDGTAIFERDADTPIKIASITKVMTALVALENSKLTDVITVDRKAATVGESAVGLKEGDTLTMEEALKGLLIMSGNDAAMAIATGVGAKMDPESDDPYQVFIDAMNAKAKELGCTDSVYENPHGLDFNGWEGDLHSTARDVVTVFAAAMKNEDFHRLDGSSESTMTVTGEDGKERTISLVARNKILGEDGNIGGKTGSTYDAGECFVGAFERDGIQVYAAVFGTDSNKARFGNTTTLADWYYDHLTTLPAVNTKVMSGNAPIVARATAADWTDKTVNVTVADPTQTIDSVFSLAGKVEQEVRLKELTGNIQAGQDAGTITYTQDGTKVGEVKLVTANAQVSPNPFEWMMIQIDRIGRFLGNQPSAAKAEVLNEAPEMQAAA